MWIILINTVYFIYQESLHPQHYFNYLSTTCQGCTYESDELCWLGIPPSEDIVPRTEVSICIHDCIWQGSKKIIISHCEPLQVR